MPKMLRIRHRTICVLLYSLAISASYVCTCRATEIDFGRDIQPILAEKCLNCHGVDNAESGLRLDNRQSALKQTESGEFAIVPQKIQQSELLRRIRSSDIELRMPPEGEPLTDEQIQKIESWISQGANWDDHWAYRPLNDSISRKRTIDRSGRNSIDVYVRTKLQEKSISPSAQADRKVLIRRIYFDLLGLPPAWNEVEAFVTDTRTNAYELLVDRVLASPRFGERWGRHWLDKARYADSDGYEKDRHRPDAWRYRDWVIHAINRDVPFDQFTQEQIAGDLLENASGEQRLATAFHRQTLTNTEGGTDKEQWRVAAVMDRTETLGAVWLGLTVGCARCHNHKYDQITQAEYYQLYAFFNNGDETQTEIDGTPWQHSEFRRKLARYQKQLEKKNSTIAELAGRVGASQSDWEANVENGSCESSDSDVAELLKIEASKRTAEQNEKIAAAYELLQKQLENEKKKLEEFKKSKPKSARMKVRVIQERDNNRRSTHILRRGEFKQPLDKVASNVLSSLASTQTLEPGASRLELVDWLVDGRNPLVPRVLVNQIWQHLFGFGLVRTPNDFGVRGDLPTHPKLLDHLAIEFVRREWSRKSLIKYIVMSATYRQVSTHRPELLDVDPTNRWLYRQNRFRLDAEVIRDASLSVAQLLTKRIGGPSVFPPMPQEAAAVSYANNFKWVTSSGEDRFRRGMYTFFKRTAPHPTLITFDCPDANVTSVQRNRSNTPIGALVLLNNTVYTEAAVALAKKIIADTDDADERLKRAFSICLSRSPNQNEMETLHHLLARSTEHYREHSRDAKKLVDREDRAGQELAAWTATLRVLLNLDEFVTRE